MGNFRQFLTELSVHNTTIFWFLDINFSKGQWIFMKLGMCIDIVEICLGIANVQISSIFSENCLTTTHPYFCFRTIT